ncbi:hypothetical protein P12x_005982 (plasmid) [Tundrisphaera lichenicola]|uniref:hypothetical protein n=1 Tax=Tundrisphaera lichenicola TaxID=2029860 RepID=UPI003EC15000
MTISNTGPDHPAGTASAHRLWVAALLGGLLASPLTWVTGEASVDQFRAKEVRDPLSETVDMAGINRVIVKNAALTHGVQGAILGLILGLAGGLTVRPVRMARLAGLSGLLLGGALGAAGSFGLFTAFQVLTDANSQDIIPSLVAHSGVAALIGAAAGLAFGMGSGGRDLAVRAAIGGLIGAALGACLYEIVGAILFPVGKTGDPLAASGSARLLWHGLVDLLAGLGAAAVANSSPPSTGEASSPTTP